MSSRSPNDEEQHGPPWRRRLSRRDLLKAGSTLGFGVVGASMLASCTPVEDAVQGAASPPDIPPAAAKYVCIVIVDGCRADYVYQNELQLPNLTAMAASGTKYANAWTGSMESITPACHACIGTGRFAKNNGGILGFYWEDPTTEIYSEHVNLTNSITQPNPGSEYALDPTSLEDILRANRIPTMASLLKAADPTAKVYAGAGAKFYAADAAGGPDADFITYIWNYGGDYYRGVNMPGHKSIPKETLDSVYRNDYTDSNYGNRTKHIRPAPGQVDTMVVELARKVITQERPRLVILNLGAMDWPYGHLNGGIQSPRWWKQVMSNADDQIGHLMETYRQLGIFDQTAFMFLGDHGMVPLQQQVNRQVVFDAVTSAGAELVPFGGGGGLGADFHTGGFLWLTNPTQAFRVVQFVDDAILAGNLPGVLAVYFRSSDNGRPQFLPSAYTSTHLTPATDAAYRYLLETINGSNAPHVVLLFEELTGTLGAGGYTTEENKQVPLQWHGDHGGASWSSHWIPLIISGAGIRKGHVSKFPARLVDLAPTALRLLGAPYPQLDGIVLADALAYSYKSESSAQTQMGSHLLPVISAMVRQAKADITKIKTYGAQNPPTGNPSSTTGRGPGTY